jgi:hypothetical protein
MSFNLRRRREEELGVINHPSERGSGVERGVRPSQVDGSAGVRKSRENVTDMVVADEMSGGGRGGENE